MAENSGKRGESEETRLNEEHMKAPHADDTSHHGEKPLSYGTHALRKQEGTTSRVKRSSADSRRTESHTSKKDRSTAQYGKRLTHEDGKTRSHEKNGSDCRHESEQSFKRSAQKRINLAPRRVALETLLDVSRSDAYASLALDKRLAQARLSPRDRAFVTTLVYGTLENRLTLDWRIDQYLKDDKALEPTVREILRIGAYQLFYLDRVPDMAAVDESVSLTRAMGLEAMTGLVNAVLRNMIREKDRVLWPKPEDDPALYLSVMFSAPEALTKMLIRAYGERGALDILRYRPQERPVTIRVNALRCDDARLRHLLADDEFEFEPGLLPGMYKVHHAGDLTRLRAFQNGLFTIQGESSVIAAKAVGAKPGQNILDACAAPGGKTAVLSEMMEDTGRVHAWDIHPHRVELIRNMVSRLKLDNVRPVVRDASIPRPDLAMTFDAALVDAPCSGTGVMLEKPDVKYRINEDAVEQLTRSQMAILNAVAPMVRVGGALVYATCSILPQENEEQIRAFLAKHTEYHVESLASELPEPLAHREGPFGLQMFAHRDGTDGFFVCRMRRVTV